MFITGKLYNRKSDIKLYSETKVIVNKFLYMYT